MTDANEDNELDGELQAVLGRVTPRREWPVREGLVTDLVGKAGEEMNQQLAIKPNAARRVVSRRNRLLTAAACLVVGFMVGQAMDRTPLSRSSPDVAWGQVVEAVRKVPQIRMQLLDRGGDLNGELFYLAPSLWRLHLRDHDSEKTEEIIAFTDGNAPRAFDVATGEFLPPGDRRVKHAFPDAKDLATFQADPLMGILALTFPEGVPVGQPVKGGGEAVAGDMEVFDYAKSPTRRWARIWVLRQSRLPVRVEVFDPQVGDKTTMLLDYTDPMPAAFFDPGAFAAAVKVRKPRDMREAIRIGMPLAEGKARDPGQVFQLQGGYKLPDVSAVAASGPRTISVTVTDPGNQSKDGTSQPQYYAREARDDQGRVWLLIHGVSSKDQGTGPQFDLYYQPLEPEQVQAMPKSLTLRYVSRATGDEGQRLVGEKVVTVPAGMGAGGTSGAFWDGRWRDAAMQYLSESETPLRQLRWVERELAKVPGDLALTCKKVSLLRELNDEQAAWKLFEERVLKGLLDGSVEQGSGYLLAKYVPYLIGEGRQEEALRIADRLAELRKSDKLKIDGFQWKALGLATLSELRQNLAELEKGPQPRVIQSLSAKDGYTAWIVAFPAGEKNGSGGGSRWLRSMGVPVEGPGWASSGVTTVGDKALIGAMWTGKDEGDRKAPSLRFEPVLGNVSAPEAFRVPWRMTADLPAVALTDRDAVWNALYPKIAPPEAKQSAPVDNSPVTKLQREARSAGDRGDWALAIAKAREALGVPLGEWPAQMPDRPEWDAYFKRQEMFGLALTLPRYMAAAGQWEQAWAALQEGEAMATQAPEFAKDREGRLSQVLYVRAELIQKLTDSGRLAEAHDWLERSSRTRPVFASIPDESVTIERPWGAERGSNRRWSQIQSWARLDVQEYRLEKAEKKR